MLNIYVLKNNFIKNHIQQIEGEVLMGTGLMDMICPPSTQFAAYNKIRATKEMKIYPDYGHKLFPGFSDIVYEFMLKL